MVLAKTLRAAEGWLELGLPDEALYELRGLPADAASLLPVMQLRLFALMEMREWRDAAEAACVLCAQVKDEPDFFLRAAYCLHETGMTQEAYYQLIKGPDSLQKMPVFHYNLACYLWVLGEGETARNHLERAIEMDAEFLEVARTDSDLVGMELPKSVGF